MTTLRHLLGVGLGLGLVLVGCGGPNPGGDDVGDDVIDAQLDAVGPDAAPPGTPIVVAVGYGQRRAHSFDGITWELQEVTPDGGDDDDLFRGLTQGTGSGGFVAVGGSSAALTAISSDGVVWTPGGSARAWLGDVAWLGATLVAAGGNGLRVRSTDGGASWTDDAGYQSTHYRSVASGAGVVVAVGHSYDGGGAGGANVGVIATTDDGVAWDEVRRSGATFGSIAYGAGRFVASGATGLVATSPDGLVWTDQTVGTGVGRVIFTGTEFVLARESGLQRSPDGLTWTPSGGGPRDVIGHFDGAYLATGWPLAISRSTDLASWAPVWTPNGSGLTDMVTGISP